MENHSGNQGETHGGKTTTSAERDHARLTTNRRSFLTVGTTSLAGLAGCSSVFSDGTIPSQSEAEERTVGDVDRNSDRDPRNAILLIPDGCSSAHISAARYLKAYREDPSSHPLTVGSEAGSLSVDDADVSGHMSTFPDDPDHEITDSAAAGTAMSTGVKTYNGAIGGVQTADGFEPLETILEKARAANMATGLVTTTRLTHATPASFATHVPSRRSEEEIAAQYIDSGNVDVLLGGGRRYFAREHRTDGRDLIADAQDRGYTYVETDEELADSTGKTLGLFGSDVGRTSHMSFYIDRVNEEGNTEPWLYDMAEKAIDVLSTIERGRENGFFLMIEAGRVDHAGHSHDPVIAAEQLECDEAFGLALEYTRDENGPETALIQAPDHETGGLSLGSNSYSMDWGGLSNLQTSAERFRTEYSGGMDVEEYLGVDISGDEVRSIEQTPSDVAEVLSNRVKFGWSSNSHTGENVPVYAAGIGTDQITAHIDNTEIATILADFLAIEEPN